MVNYLKIMLSPRGEKEEGIGNREEGRRKKVLCIGRVRQLV